MLTGCAPWKTIYDNPGPDEISGMNNTNVLFPYEYTVPRYELLRDSALIYSAQCALRHYYQQINQQLLSHKEELDRAFAFQPLMLDHDVVPPVVVQTGRTVEQVGANYVVVADQSFKILKPGRFVTTPISWQEYLIRDIPRSTLPDKSQLPQNSIEEEIWARYVAQGWEAGKEQAFIMFQNNLSCLVEHYNGMVNFHRLFQQGLMTAPIIQQIENGITTSQDQMNINQKILAIAEQGFLEKDVRRWHSYVFFTD